MDDGGREPADRQGAARRAAADQAARPSRRRAAEILAAPRRRADRPARARRRALRSRSARCSRSCARSCSSRRSSSSTSPPRLSPVARSSGSSATCARCGSAVPASSSRRTAGARSSTWPTGSPSSATASTSTTRESIDESEAVTLMTGRTIDRIYPDLPPVPEDAPVALEVRDLVVAGSERLLARAAPRRDPGHRRPRRPGPARALHDALRRPEGDRRRDPRRREAQANPAPRRRDPGRPRHRARPRGPQERGAADCRCTCATT